MTDLWQYNRETWPHRLTLEELRLIPMQLNGQDRPQPEWVEHTLPYTTRGITWHEVLTLARVAEHWGELARKYPHNTYIWRMVDQARRDWYTAERRYMGG